VYLAAQFGVTQLMNSLMFGLLLIVLPGIASANTVLQVDDEVRYSINRQVDYILDDSLELTLEDVRASEQWQPINRNIVNLGFIKEAAWFRLELQAINSNDYILHLPYPILDYLDHYSFVDGEPYLEVKTGDARRFDTRGINHIDFIFPYRLEAKQILTVYLRIETEGAIDVPLRFSSKDLFLESDTENTLFRGFVLGILFLMLFYNTFIFISLRDRVYGFYVLNIFSYIVTSNVYDGGAFKYLWPNNPGLNDYIFPIFNGLILVTSILFMLALLQVMDKPSWYKKYFLMLLGIVATFPFLGALMPYSTIVPLEVAFSLIVYTSSLILGVHLSLKGNRTAMYFTVAVCLFMVGLVSSNLKALGLLPTNFFTQHAYQVGFFVDMVVLSLALAQKIDVARKERSWAQRENIKNLKRYEDLYSESLSGNFQVTLKGKIVSVNNAFLEMLGYGNEKELFESKMANDINLFSKDRNTSIFIINTVKRCGRIVDFEEAVVRKDKSIIWVSLSVRTVTNSEGIIEYYEGSMLDINERKENETLRDQAMKDRMSTLEQLVVGVSHELNTPLGTSITGLSHLKQLMIEMNSRKKENSLSATLFDSIINEEFQAVELTTSNLEKVCELIKQFKHISVNQHGYEIGSVNLLAVISSGLVRFKDKLSDNNVVVQVNCDEDINIITYGDAISEIVMQLVSNSLDHAFDEMYDKQIEITASLKGLDVVLLYQDNGRGLSDKGKVELFNPFYTTMRGNQGKVGLGMYLTFNLLTQLLMGGVEVEKPEQGISITMKFPSVVVN
jgi:PAS domain S-box-containing protein